MLILEGIGRSVNGADNRASRARQQEAMDVAHANIGWVGYLQHGLASLIICFRTPALDMPMMSLTHPCK